MGAYQMEYESHAVEPLPIRNLDRVRTYCKTVATWLSDTSMKPSLIILGGVGTGKTTMLKSIKYWMQAIGVGVRYVKANDLPVIAADDYTSYLEMLKPNTSYDFLLIDDVGEEPAELNHFGNKISLFSRILEGRYDYRLPTIITTNLSLSKEGEVSFKTQYSERVNSRIMETFNTLLMTGDDYREV